MNSYNPQMYDESKTIRKQKGNQSGRVFYIILIGLAISGCLILALSLLVPHKTGTVISVGRISSSTHSSGMRNRGPVDLGLGPVLVPSGHRLADRAGRRDPERSEDRSRCSAVTGRCLSQT